MTTSSFEGTAKIYQFPRGGRAGLTSGRYEAKPMDEFALRTANVVAGGAWYHEEAVREAAHTRKN
jgi:Protein of unknown function (DUF2735)